MVFRNGDRNHQKYSEAVEKIQSQRREDLSLQDGIRALKIDVQRVLLDRNYDDDTPPSARMKNHEKTN